MTEVRDLYYYGEPTEEQRLALRRGKDLLGVDWMVRPVPVCKMDQTDAAVLCFREPPMTPPYTPARMAAALKEVLGLTPGDYLTTPEEWLSNQFGQRVKFLFEEDA
jgi:hypothetical protein